MVGASARIAEESTSERIVCSPQHVDLLAKLEERVSSQDLAADQITLADCEDVGCIGFGLLKAAASFAVVLGLTAKALKRK